jgi:hypothetical protein
LWEFPSQNYEPFWYSRFSLYPKGRWPKKFEFQRSLVLKFSRTKT